MTILEIDPASFTWSRSDEEPWYDVTYEGVHVTKVLLVGLPELSSEGEADLRAQLKEDLEERLAEMSHHQRLAFWGQVVRSRS